eukprot:CAMPEP_0174251474 /NCGR_PEP_ID=MMETSP0439-20130205/1289_1 /TAXON_ID=0 /ORGANISM="Stereomyxa ramosa, Strain Chinc5" /LENGTH=332 /DNA_ID=CAMNT_0015331801 /DNA_START=226 /DNA_END=1224 /DNA_ORIENTATION=+
MLNLPCSKTQDCQRISQLRNDVPLLDCILQTCQPVGRPGDACQFINGTGYCKGNGVCNKNNTCEGVAVLGSCNPQFDDCDTHLYCQPTSSKCSFAAQENKSCAFSQCDKNFFCNETKFCNRLYSKPVNSNCTNTNECQADLLCDDGKCVKVHGYGSQCRHAGKSCSGEPAQKCTCGYWSGKSACALNESVTNPGLWEYGKVPGSCVKAFRNQLSCVIAANCSFFQEVSYYSQNGTCVDTYCSSQSKSFFDCLENILEGKQSSDQCADLDYADLTNKVTIDYSTYDKLMMIAGVGIGIVAFLCLISIIFLHVYWDRIFQKNKYERVGVDGGIY